MKVLIVGDSFTYGQGCSDREYYYDKRKKEWIGDGHFYLKGPSEFCWPSLIKKDYPQHEFINLGQPGADNTFMFTKIQQNIKDVDLVIFAGTGHNRMQVSGDPPGSIMNWVIGIHDYHIDRFSKDYIKAHEYFVKHIYQEQFFIDITVSTVYGVYGLCKQKDIKLFWSLPFFKNQRYKENPEGYPKYIERLSDLESENYFESLMGYPWPDVELSDMPVFGKNPYISRDFHANDIGQKKYYDLVIKPMLENDLRGKK